MKRTARDMAKHTKPTTRMRRIEPDVVSSNLSVPTSRLITALRTDKNARSLIEPALSAGDESVFGQQLTTRL